MALLTVDCGLLYNFHAIAIRNTLCMRLYLPPKMFYLISYDVVFRNLTHQVDCVP